MLLKIFFTSLVSGFIIVGLAKFYGDVFKGSISDFSTDFVENSLGFLILVDVLIFIVSVFTIIWI